MKRTKCVNYITDIQVGQDEQLQQFWIVCGECQARFHASTPAKAYRQFQEHNAIEKMKLDN